MPGVNFFPCTAGYRNATMAWVPLTRFLAKAPSLGPRERVDGEASSHEAYDADMLTLLALVPSSDALRHVACIPDTRLCVHERGERVLVRPCGAPAPRGWARRIDVRAGVVVTDVRSAPTLWLPAGFEQALDGCRRRGKRFAVCNLGLYDRRALVTGHANALVFDLRARRVERFDPAGAVGVERSMRRLFRAHLPGWSYVGIASTIQAVADAHSGLCVTYALMFTLLRLLNPERDAREVAAYMVRGTPDGVRRRALRLNRFMMDTLRRHPHGSLRRL